MVLIRRVKKDERSRSFRIKRTNKKEEVGAWA